MREVVVFLGAGASSEFSLPTIRQMTERFFKRYPHYRPQISSMRDQLRKIGFAPNIENMLSYARGQLRPRATLLNSSPYVSYFVSNSTTRKLGYFPAAKKMIDDLQEFIYDNCAVHEFITVRKIVELYSDFLEHVKRRFGLGESPIDIYTTNYDNVVETFCDSQQIDVFDGYEKAADGTCIFSPQLYRQPWPIRLYKLHGSVTMSVVQNRFTAQKRVVDTQIGLKIGDAYTANEIVVDRFMIHGYEKDPSSEPYFDLLYLVKEGLTEAKRALVVGYSFSDRPILNMFIDVLNSRNISLEIIILDKNARSIKERLFRGNKLVRDITAPFKEFGQI